MASKLRRGLDLRFKKIVQSDPDVRSFLSLIRNYGLREKAVELLNRKLEVDRLKSRFEVKRPWTYESGQDLTVK